MIFWFWLSFGLSALVIIALGAYVSYLDKMEEKDWKLRNPGKDWKKRDYNIGWGWWLNR